MRGKVDVLMGLQRGDEGKGRFIDILAPDYQAIARYNGGPNAGHTVVIDGVEINLHQIPSGITHPDTLNLITHTSLFDPIAFLEEREHIEKFGFNVNPDRLKIGWNAQLIMPHHIMLDSLAEKSKNKHGTTQRGIGPAAASRYLKTGGTAELIARGDYIGLERLALSGLAEYNSLAARRKGLGRVNRKEIVDVWITKIQESDIAEMVCDTDQVVREILDDRRYVLAEGAQAAMLDVTRGRVPRTTSSHTGLAGAIDGLGISHYDIGKVMGVVKLFTTQVGEGHFSTFINDPAIASVLEGEEGSPDQEKGKTSGRVRPSGWLDIPVINSAITANGVSELIVTKLDKAEDLRDKANQTHIKIATHYEDETGPVFASPPSERRAQELEAIYKELPIWDGSVVNLKFRKDLPKEAESILKTIELSTGRHVVMAGVGYERDQYVADVRPEKLQN